MSDSARSGDVAEDLKELKRLLNNIIGQDIWIKLIEVDGELKLYMFREQLSPWEVA